MTKSIEDLQQDILSMSREERLERLREVREDRKISKHAVTVRKKREQDKTTKMTKAFEGLSAEEQAKLLELLKDD